LVIWEARGNLEIKLQLEKSFILSWDYIVLHVVGAIKERRREDSNLIFHSYIQRRFHFYTNTAVPNTMRMNTKLAPNILVDDICGTEPLTAANVGSLVVEVESEPKISSSSNSLCELAQRVIPEFGVEVAAVEIPVFDEAIDTVEAVVELLELDAIEILNTPELV
jgi:hypothetical protein